MKPAPCDQNRSSENGIETPYGPVVAGELPGMVTVAELADGWRSIKWPVRGTTKWPLWLGSGKLAVAGET